MKKFFLIASAICMAMTVSCNKEILTDEPDIDYGGEELSGVMVDFTFPASREITKASLDDNTFSWQDGDQVALCYGTTVAPFTYNATKGWFEGTIDASASGPFSVVSPYNSNISVSGDLVHTQLPALQIVYEGATADPAAFLAVGQASDKDALQAGVKLLNAFSLIQFSITDSDVKSVSFEGNAEGTGISAQIAGEFDVNVTDAKCSLENRTTAVTLRPEKACFAPGTYTMAVLPCELADGMKIVFKRDGNDMAYYRSTSESVSLARNKGLSLGSFNVSGIAGRCYYIQDAADMQVWGGAVPDGSDVVFVGADIDMTGYTPWKPVDAFAGTFDGQNHRIYNFIVNTDSDAGLFAITSEAGAPLIKNFVLGSEDGVNWDTVSCIEHSGCTVTDVWMYAGVVGKARGKTSIINVHNYAKVMVGSDSQAQTRIGGICGNWASTGTLKACVNKGSLRNEAASAGSKNVIGGIVAQGDGAGAVEDCENYGMIVNENDQTSFIGGIYAYCAQNTTVKGCTNYGDIYANKFKINAWGGMGGVLGYLATGTAEDCHSKGNYVTNLSDVSDEAAANRWRVNTGGLVGYLEGATVKNCTVEFVNVYGPNTYDVGGLVGVTESAPVIQDCQVFDYTVVKGSQRTGGIVGYVMGKSNTSISGCSFSDSEVHGTYNVGGIAGWFDTGTISGCRVDDGALVESSADGVGGIVGRAIAKGGSDNFLLDCVVDDASVTGAYSVGGILGYAYPDAQGNVDIYNCQVSSSTITAKACDSSGDPTKGDSMIAGICGWMRCSDSGSNFKIVNCCVNTPLVCALSMVNASVGGAIGYCSLSAAGKGEVSNFCMASNQIKVGGADITSASSVSRFGGVYGYLPDRNITVSSCFYPDSLPIGDAAGGNVAFSGNEAVNAGDMADSSVILPKLNAFLSSYSGSIALKSWVMESGAPALDL